MNRIYLLHLLLLCLFTPQLLASENLTPPPEFSEHEKKAIAKAKSAIEEIHKSKEDTTKATKRLVRDLELLNRRKPNDPLVNYYLAIGYQLTRKYDRAERTIKKSLRKKPKFYEALVELADIHVWKKEFDDAVKNYDKAIAIEPRYYPSFERKGRALLEMGKYKESKATLQKALKLIPENPNVQMLLTMIELQLRGPRWRKTYTKESSNYIVKTSVSDSYAKLISDRMERILKIYKKIFPSIKKPDRKYEVWVYSSKGHYVAAGNPRGAGGHYEPLVRKLVLFKYEKLADLELVLNHEGFHQFLHDYIQRIPQWFNEGLADYYGGYVYEKRGSKHYMVPKPNPWRLRLIKQVIAAKRTVDTAELMQMTRGEMYSSQGVSINYAQAWAMVYYCIEGGKKRKYDKVLINYFKALRKGYDIEKAYATTFGRINMEKFDKAWKTYIMGLK